MVLAAIGVIGLSAPAHAGTADVVAVKVFKLPKIGPDVFRFRVTVRHADDGWDHYADRWQVVSPDGTVLGTRVLAHPHDNEQPFTRLKDLRVPVEIKRVTIRAGDKVHGFGGREMTVEVPH